MIEKYNNIVTAIVLKYLQNISLEEFDGPVFVGDFDIMEYNGVLQGPVEFSDMYFNLDDIILAYKHKIPGKIFIDYYELCLECYENNKEPGINLYNYWRKQVLSPEYIEKERQEDLKISEDRVKKAKKDLEDIIKSKI